MFLVLGSGLIFFCLPFGRGFLGPGGLPLPGRWVAIVNSLQITKVNVDSRMKRVFKVSCFDA